MAMMMRWVNPVKAYEQGLKDGTVPFDMEFEEYLELMRDQSKAPQQGRRMAAGGGIMGSNNGSMLAARTADGSRPKYGFLGQICTKTYTK